MFELNEIASRQRWIVCQIGARENYSIARALAQQNALVELITDRWVPPGSVLGRLIPQLTDRHHEGIGDSSTFAPTLRGLNFELLRKLEQKKGWNRIIERNQWFDKIAAGRLSKIARNIGGTEPVTVFAYSYAAAETFRVANSLGWRTVLGQIDPGPEEANTVKKLYKDAGQHHFYEAMPKDYWANWRNEISLADTIVANSNWTSEALVRSGVPESKLKIVPLAYEPSQPIVAPLRSIPDSFGKSRPLRALFLGQITLRKGVGPIFDAIKSMRDAPICVDFIGQVQAEIPKHIQEDDRVTFHDAVSRDQVGNFYKAADVFLFPTLSDGFGLTQLEAQSWGLPIIASRNCGEVVTDGVNGRLLCDVTPDTVDGALREIIRNPSLLEHWSSNSQLANRFSMRALGSNLLCLPCKRNLA